MQAVKTVFLEALFLIFSLCYRSRSARGERLILPVQDDVGRRHSQNRVVCESRTV